ncbi:MAG TPA: recombination mediator RecR [Planctomycetota bacterium]|jgi:recombination protein RecR
MRNDKTNPQSEIRNPQSARPQSGAPADSFERLIVELEKLPGIGRRSAERMAYHLLGADKTEAMKLARAIHDVKEKLHPCAICGDLTEHPRCAICENPHRQRDMICVVEWPREVHVVEKSAQFSGLYHVLMGRISPLSGVEPADLRIATLLDRLKDGTIRELVLATSPSVEGDATAIFVAQQARRVSPNIKTTRLARGVPAGSDLSFAQSGTIGEALKGRTELSNIST